MDSTEAEMKLIKKASLAALAIDPQNPRIEAIELLRELNIELERVLN